MPDDPTDTVDASASAVSGCATARRWPSWRNLLDELEDADIDVDHLAARVARGVELVRFCRDRLAVVTADVDQVVADLVVADDAGSGSGADSGSGSAQ